MAGCLFYHPDHLNCSVKFESSGGAAVAPIPFGIASTLEGEGLK